MDAAKAGSEGGSDSRSLENDPSRHTPLASQLLGPVRRSSGLSCCRLATSRLRAARGELLQQHGEFPWTSITRRAFDRSDCKRAFSRRSRANSCSRGSVDGRPGEAVSAWSAPSSRCLRHSEIDDVYSPSRRRRAPLPLRSRRSYSSRILSLYCGKNTRRVARSGTSGSTGSLTGTACRPATNLVITIAYGSSALRLTDFGSRPASPNVDPEGVERLSEQQRQQLDALLESDQLGRSAFNAL